MYSIQLIKETGNVFTLDGFFVNNWFSSEEFDLFEVKGEAYLYHKVNKTIIKLAFKTAMNLMAAFDDLRTNELGETSTIKNIKMDYLKDGAVSNLKVMHSMAGYYIGTSYYDKDTGTDLPNSRDSGYFQTKALAKYYMSKNITLKDVKVLYLNSEHLSASDRLELEVMKTSAHITIKSFPFILKKDIFEAEVIIFSQAPYKQVLLKSKY